MTTESVLLFLKRKGTKSNIETMKHFGIKSPNAFGVNTPTLRKLAQQIGTDHRLALSLWKAGYHEARVLASLIADPEKVTERLMEQWVRDFDSWAICDACCAELFDNTPFAISKAFEWSKNETEYVKRAGFVMMAALAVHRKELDDGVFKKFFPVIEHESNDGRNFVKKAVNWALRQIGKRNTRLHAEAMKVAVKLSKQEDSTARWIGADAIKDLQSDAVRRKFARMKANL
ncbi:MAG: DNA alkylation repair protein [Bacteroidota bacterium]